MFASGCNRLWCSEPGIAAADAAEDSDEEAPLERSPLDAFDLEEPVVEEAVATEAERDEVVVEVAAALGAVLQVVQLETILARSSARLALSIVTIKDGLPHPVGNGLGVFTGEMVLVVLNVQAY